METAKSYGIAEDYSFDFLVDNEGMGVAFDAISKKMSVSRKAPRFAKSSNACMKKVTADYIKRNKNK